MELTKCSITSLVSYDNCPYCWYLNRIGVPYHEPQAFTLGTEVHKGIEDYHRDGQISQGRAGPFLEIYAKHYDWKIPCQTEVAFELPFLRPKTGDGFGFNLIGHIDRIAQGWIFEHKTASKRWTQREVDESLQTTAYAWGYRSMFGEEAKGIRYNILVKNKTPKLEFLETFVTTGDCLYLFEWVKERVDLIRKDFFEPKACRWHLYSVCPGNQF